jgi:hypothetical protein
VGGDSGTGNPPHAPGSAALANRADSTSGFVSADNHSSWNRWAVLMMPYRHGAEYWEVIITGRRITLALAQGVVPRSSPVMPVLVFSLLLASLIAQLLYRPYRTRLFNYVEQGSLFILTLTFFVAALTNAASGGSAGLGGGSTALVGITFGINMAFVVGVGFLQAREIALKTKTVIATHAPSLLSMSAARLWLPRSGSVASTSDAGAGSPRRKSHFGTTDVNDSSTADNDNVVDSNDNNDDTDDTDLDDHHNNNNNNNNNNNKGDDELGLPQAKRSDAIRDPPAIGNADLEHNRAAASRPRLEHALPVLGPQRQRSNNEDDGNGAIHESTGRLGPTLQSLPDLWIDSNNASPGRVTSGGGTQNSNDDISMV